MYFSFLINNKLYNKIIKIVLDDLFFFNMESKLWVSLTISLVYAMPYTEHFAQIVFYHPPQRHIT